MGCCARRRDRRWVFPGAPRNRPCAEQRAPTDAVFCGLVVPNPPHDLAAVEPRAAEVAAPESFDPQHQAFCRDGRHVNGSLAADFPPIAARYRQFPRRPTDRQRDTQTPAVLRGMAANKRLRPIRLRGRRPERAARSPTGPTTRRRRLRARPRPATVQPVRRRRPGPPAPRARLEA